MAVDFDLDSVDGVVIGVVRGTLTLRDIQAHAAALWDLVRGPRARVLWDLRDARFDLEIHEIRSLAEFVQENSPVTDLRMALLVSGDLAFGLVRMFEAFRETEQARAAAFRDREEALAWLSREPD